MFDYKRRKEAERPLEPFTYDDPPQGLREQMALLVNEIYHGRNLKDLYGYYLLEDHAFRKLVSEIKWKHIDSFSRSINHLAVFMDVFQVVDDVELFVSLVEVFSKSDRFRKDANRFFRNARFGYQFHHVPTEDDPYRIQAFRVDAEYIHSEVVMPVLQLISEPKFSTVQEEFIKAHSAYLDGDYSTAVVECNKAFESTLKIACHERGFDYENTQTANTLIDTLWNSDFFPDYLKEFLPSIRAMLLNTSVIRNKIAAHGKGTSTFTLDASVAKLALHTSAALIVFVVDNLDT